MEPKTFTVFCMEANRSGTTWISSIESTSIEAAETAAKEQCSADWGGHDTGDIVVIGVAAGNVEILKWED